MRTSSDLPANRLHDSTAARLILVSKHKKLIAVFQDRSLLGVADRATDARRMDLLTLEVDRSLAN
jgi:hypothetical protein